jgi:hypothetical protein
MQIRSANSLLVAADELRDLERGHQPVRQSARRGRRIRRRVRRRRSMRRFHVRRLPHRYLRSAVASNAISTPDFWMTNRAGMVRRQPIGLWRSARAAGSVGRDSERGAQCTLESTPTEAVDAWRMCATHRPFTRPCRAASRNERTRAAVFDGVTGPSVVAWTRRTMCRPLSGRGRVECRYRLTYGRRILRLRPFQPFRSWVLLAADLWAGGLEALHGT